MTIIPIRGEGEMCDGVIATRLLRVQRLRDKIFMVQVVRVSTLELKGEAWGAYLKGEVLSSVILYIRIVYIIHFMYCESTK